MMNCECLAYQLFTLASSFDKDLTCLPLKFTIVCLTFLNDKEYWNSLKQIGYVLNAETSE